MRVSKANKLYVSAFLLFHVTAATVALAEHTSSLTQSFASGAKSEQAGKRLHTSRALQKYPEDPIVLTGLDNQVSSPQAEAKITLAPTRILTNGPNGPTLSRAPPVPL
jgi:hypothetical protein